MRPTKMLAVSTALFLCAAYAAAQAPPADSLKVDYFAYAHTTGAPDATIHLTNPGTTGTNVCAAIYVFESGQEMSECCSCLLTPNDLRTLSVNTDVTNNPLTGFIIHTGSITIVSTSTVSGACPLPTSLNPISGGVRAWATHIDYQRVAGTTSGFVGSAANSQDAPLSAFELDQLQNDCYDISLMNYGIGICTCGTGD